MNDPMELDTPQATPSTSTSPHPPITSSLTPSTSRPSSPASTANPKLCPICNSDAAYRCPDCPDPNFNSPTSRRPHSDHPTFYCDPTCALMDEPVHSTVCERIDPPQPQNVHACRAIFFPPNSTEMQFIWLKLYNSPNADGSEDIDRAQLAELWGRPIGQLDLRSIIVTQNHRRLRNLQSYFCIIHDDGAGNGRFGLNRAVAQYVRPKTGEGSKGKSGGRKYSQGSAMSGWRGPVLVVSIVGKQAGEPFETRDIERWEMRDVVDVLENNWPTAEGKAGPEALALNMWEVKPGKRVLVNMLRCARDFEVKSNARRRFAAYSDTQLAAIKEKVGGEEVVLGNMIGLPMRLFGLTSGVRKAHPRNSVCHDEDKPCDLLWMVGVLRWHGMNPGRYNMGFHLKDCLGELLIVREDGKELTGPQFETLTWLAKKIGSALREAFEDSDTYDETNTGVNKALALATKKNWLLYFAEVRGDQLKKGRKEWEDAEPY